MIFQSESIVVSLVPLKDSLNHSLYLSWRISLPNRKSASFPSYLKVKCPARIIYTSHSSICLISNRGPLPIILSLLISLISLINSLNYSIQIIARITWGVLISLLSLLEIFNVGLNYTDLFNDGPWPFFNFIDAVGSGVSRCVFSERF